MRLRSCVTTSAALAPALLALTGALLGVYSGARLAQHDAGASLALADVPTSWAPVAGTRSGLAMVVSATGSQPAEITFGEAGQAMPQAIFGQRITSPATGLDTVSLPLTAIFLGNAQARHEGKLDLIPMLLQGQVRGVVHLEGQKTSLGGYVAVGAEVHFLEPGGGFSFPWSGGPADIVIKAPGYLSVVVSRAEVAAGAVLTVPELTLPFGDANGDGRIDVLDLSIAAANFGEATRQIPPP